MIMPYVKRLKRYLQEGNSSQVGDLIIDNQSQKSKKHANGLSSNGNGSTDVNKKRQRHKSLGDLDGVKPLSGVSIGLQQQPTKILTNPLGNLGSAVIASNGKRNKVKPNSKRQLFPGEGSSGGDCGVTGQYFFDDNANATPPSYGKLSNSKTNNSKQSMQQLIRPKNLLQKKALVPIDDFINSDPCIDKWKHFTFDLSKLFTVKILD